MLNIVCDEKFAVVNYPGGGGGASGCYRLVELWRLGSSNVGVHGIEIVQR